MKNDYDRSKSLEVLAMTLLVLFAGLRMEGQDPSKADSQRQYQVVAGFPQLPDGWTLEAVAGVATDSKDNLLVFHRGKHPIILFDKNGKYLRSFGDGMFKSAHGLRVDSDDHIWVTDNANHTVTQFSHDGKVLMKLGQEGVPGEDETHFNRPADVAFAPNGDFYVADGYGNSRVVKFDRNGKFLLAWGKKGTGPGEFNLPHAVRLDSHGQVFVGDRENDRIQVFDSHGKFLWQIPGMAPFGLFFVSDDTLFLADGRANEVMHMTRSGKILTRWGSIGSEPGNFILPHGITVGSDGAVYVGEINGKRVQKFVLK